MPPVTELNPENPSTVALRDQWVKMVAMTLYKLKRIGVRSIIITSEDIEGLNLDYPGGTVTVTETPDAIVLELIPVQEAMRRVQESHGVVGHSTSKPD